MRVRSDSDGVCVGAYLSFVGVNDYQDRKRFKLVREVHLVAQPVLEQHLGE